MYCFLYHLLTKTSKFYSSDKYVFKNSSCLTDAGAHNYGLYLEAHDANYVGLVPTINDEQQQQTEKVNRNLDMTICLHVRNIFIANSNVG